MTLQEAYIKASSVAKGKGHTLLTSCKDYGDFWGFGFKPPTFDIDASPEKAINGLGTTTVNKKTGEIGIFIPPMNLDLFKKAKSIPIDQFVEKAAVA